MTHKSSIEGICDPRIEPDLDDALKDCWVLGDCDRCPAKDVAVIEIKLERMWVMVCRACLAQAVG